MKYSFQKIFSSLALALIFAASAASDARATVHQATYMSQSGWGYSIHYNNLDHPVAYMTQLTGGEFGVIGITDVAVGGVGAPIGNLVLPVGQSAIIPSIPSFFLSGGNGEIHFQNGLVVTLADLLPFTGTASTFVPTPDQIFPCSETPSCFGPAANPVAVIGFNLAPGQHPTAIGANGDPAPTDGLAIPANSSIVMFWDPSTTEHLGVGSVAFHIRDGIIQSSAFSGQTMSYTPQIPEPGTWMMLLTSGILGVTLLRRKSSLAK